MLIKTDINKRQQKTCFGAYMILIAFAFNDDMDNITTMLHCTPQGIVNAVEFAYDGNVSLSESRGKPVLDAREVQLYVQ